MGAVTGAVKGAAEGAIAGPQGAVAGAAAGGAAGHKKAKEERAAKAGDRVGGGIGKAVTGNSGRKMLLAEFFICIIILGLSPLGSAPNAGSQDGTATDTGSIGTQAGQFMLKGSATCGLFLVLGLIAAIGPNVSKYAAGIGGLVTLAVVFNAANSFSGMVDSLSNAKAAEVTPKSAPDQSTDQYNPPAWASLMSPPTVASQQNGNANSSTPLGSDQTGTGVGPLDIGNPAGPGVNGGIR